VRRCHLDGLFAIFLAAAVVLVLLTNDLGAPVGNGDEAIYAEFVRSMHATGDYLTLRYHDAVVTQRPVWPVAAYALVARVVPGAAGLRLLPVLLSWLTTLLVGLAVFRLHRRAAAAAVAMLSVAAAPAWLTYGRLAWSDPPFVLACTAAVVATAVALASPRPLVWVGAALGLALATKSLAAAIPALALAPWLLAAVRRHRRAAVRPLLVGGAVLVALAAPYYVYSFVRFGRYFLHDHFGQVLLARARGELPGVGLSGGAGAYVVHIVRDEGWAFALAAVAVLVAATVFGLRERRGGESALLVPASYVLVVLACLSLLGTRLAHYLLPVYPALGLCAGGVVARLQEAAERRGRGALAAVVALAAALVLVSTGLSQPPFDGSVLPAPQLVALGRSAAAVLAPSEPVYSLDFYAPALGYHADHRWRLLTTSARMAVIVGDVDVFAGDHTVVKGPPWPPGRLVVAVPDGVLAHAPELLVTGRIAAERGIGLYEMASVGN